MPTYEYKCPAGHRFEKIFPRITSKRHTKCPVCGKSAERQISGGGGLVFKGTGFYQTDYKQRPAEKTEKSEKSDKSEKSEPAPKPKKDSGSDK